MSAITLVRQPHRALTDAEKGVVREALFGMIDGLGERGKKQWRRLWNGLMRLEPGEMVEIITHKPRVGVNHRRHMLIESRLFEAQERFTEFESFRYWLKVGAGWVTWAAGPKGGVVPIPKSISYAAAEEGEFQEFHEAAMNFLRGPHAAGYLWPHLKGLKADEMMDSILSEFDE